MRGWLLKFALCMLRRARRKRDKWLRRVDWWTETATKLHD